MVKRLALVKDGVVQNAILVEDNQVDAYEAPEGQSKILSETASPGDTFDGSNFAAPVPEKNVLVMHARKRFGDYGYARHRVGKVVIYLDMIQRYTFDSLVARAKVDPAFTAKWVMWRAIPTVTVTLNAQQLIAFGQKLIEHDIRRAEAFADVIEAINMGMITSHDQVDRPPPGVTRWPHRFHEEDPTA